MLNEARFQAVVANMKTCGFHQILVADDNAMLYLLGQKIHPFERAGALLIKDTGEIHAYMNHIFCFEPDEKMQMHYYSDGEDIYQMIADELDPGEVGFDKEWQAKHVIGILMKREDIRPVLGSEPIDLARSTKDGTERDHLRYAAQINDQAVAYGIGHVDAEITEKELADQIEKFFESKGAVQDMQYQLVCFGENAAEPHHMPDDTKVKEGDAVLFDLWAPVNDYWCDMTRTVFYKNVSEKHRELYEIVKKAQQTGIDFVKPGVRMSDVDKVVRQVIEDAGYGKYFITRTGHGVGITVHEPPFAAADCDLIAQEGMVFSIEPGIYLAGEIGIRIEDLVLVTSDGCEVLTKYPKDLQIIK